MALAALGVRPGASRGGERQTADTALTFAFDAAYLEPFKVLLYSLVRTGTMLESPVHVISDDPKVFEDEVVRAVTDLPVLVTGTLRDQLYELAEHHVKRPERRDWNRGTCLKWAAFATGDVEQRLFLDVDMLCLAPLEPLLDLHPRQHGLAAPQFQRQAFVEDGEPVTPRVAGELLEGLVAGTARHHVGRINSGMMLLRRPLLDDGFRARLIAYACRHVEVNEQSHLTRFFRDADARGSHRMKMVASAYNFHESYLGLVDAPDAQALMRQVRVLHYPGAPKPWRVTPGPETRPSTALWSAYREGAAADGLL